jgi:hypothetical protein
MASQRKVTISNNEELAKEIGIDEVVEVSRSVELDEPVIEESTSIEDLEDSQEIWDGGPNAGMIKEWKKIHGEVYVTSLSFDKHIVWRVLSRLEYKTLVKKMEQHNATAYMVNTGWNGTGKRISIKDTRAIIDAILEGSIEKAETKIIPVFNFEVPTVLHDVNPAILDPRDTYADATQWQTKADDLASRFVKNFVQYTDNEEGKNLVAAGPQLG